MNKKVIVINGKGGSGKDTICDIVKKTYCVKNVSSIDPIKDIALDIGWDGEKDTKGRKLLSDLKMAFSNYNDMPMNYLKHQYEQFIINPVQEIMFVHIREPQEIEKFKRDVCPNCITMLVTRKGVDTSGNFGDDNVYGYIYDHVYRNDGTLENLEEDFMDFFNRCVMSK